MTLNEIKRVCVNHCWVESYKRQIKSYENRLKAINERPDTDSSFDGFPKKERLDFFKRRLIDAKESLQNEEDMRKRGMYHERHCSCVTKY